MDDKHYDNRSSDFAKQIANLNRAINDLKEIEDKIGTSPIEFSEVVKRDQKDVFHQITIGSVFVAHNFSAHDAKNIDGLLSACVKDIQSWDELSKIVLEDDVTVAQLIATLLDLSAGRLNRLGTFAEWRRSYDRYISRMESFVASDAGSRLECLAGRPVSAAQKNLIRYTARTLNLTFPKLADRKQAYLWLRDAGANPRYMETNNGI